MNKLRITNKSNLTGWMLTGVLLALLLIAVPVFADGEEPAQAPAAAETAPETEPAAPEADAPQTEEAPAETAPEADAPQAEEAPVEAESEADAPQAEEAPAETESEADAPQAEEALVEAESEADAPQGEEEPAQADETESIPQALAEAELVLADGNGEAVDMASAESAEAISAGDPWWKVDTTLYATVRTGAACPDGTTLGVTCWQSDEPITEALNQIVASGALPTDRKIYVEADVLDYDETVNIDATTYPILAQLKGLIGGGSGGTVIDGNVYLDSMTSGFTLSGFTIKGTVGVWNSTGTLILQDLDVTSPDNTGIYIVNNFGNVEVREVRSNNNDSHGAEINTTNGTVKIINSSFDDNGNALDNAWPETGLSISTNKAITLEGVSASRNMGNGIELFDFSALTIKNTLANYNDDPNYNTAYYGYGTGEYNQSGYGIKADSWGKASPVTLENVYANYNGLKGIYVSTMGSLKAKNVEAQYNTIRKGSILYDETYWICESGNCEVFPDDYTEVTNTIKRVSEFLSDDVDYDEWRFTLDAETSVVIELGAYNSFAPQVCLRDGSTETCADGGEYGSFAQLSDTLAAGTYFIRVYSYNGGEYGPYDLSVNWSDDDDDYNNEASLDTGGMSFSDWDGKGTVRLENGLFHHNGGDGLSIRNNNTVYLSSITATDNGGDGIYVDKTKMLRDYNTGILTGYGATGTVTLTSPKATGGVTGNMTNGNGGFGVNIQSKGNILVSNIDASNNGGSGMYLDTCLADWGTGVCMGAGGVTVNVTIPHWANRVTDNGYMGLDVSSAGTIYLAGTSASWNGDYGAYLTTLNAPAARTVTVIDSNFDGNNNTGLKVLTAGAINVQGSSASWNLSPEWMTLDSLPMRVFDQLYDGQGIDGYMFYGSQYDAFDAVLMSDDFNAFISLWFYDYDLETWVWVAEDDDGWGDTDAHIDGFSLPADGWYSLDVSDADASAFGAYELALNGVDGDKTLFPGSGMDLDNTAGTAGVTFKPTKTNPNAVADDNANMGVKINSNGAVSVSGMGASGNYRTGLSVSTTKAVTVQDTAKVPASTFDGNGWSGIYVRTLSNIKLYGVSASNNFEGVNLDNCMEDSGVCTGKGSILIGNKSNVMSYFNENGDGIQAYSSGAITLINASASDNWGGGALLKNAYDGLSAGVTVKTAGAVVNDFSGNQAGGLGVFSNGVISVSNTSANRNDFSGIYLDNSNAGAAKNVTLSNATANDNTFGAKGIEINSLGNISVMNVETSGNDRIGTFLNNQYDGYAGNVALKFSKGSMNFFDNNNGAGLEIFTNGAVTMGNIHAQGNYKTSGWLGGFSTGDTVAVQEFYNDIVDEEDETIRDEWGFYIAEPGMYSFFLNAEVDLDPFGFDPLLTLVDNDGNQLAQNNNNGGSPNSFIEYTFASTGYYYLHAESAPEDMDGFYKLSINDPLFNNLDEIYTNGVVVFAGKNVTLSGSQSSELRDNSLTGLFVVSGGNISIKDVRVTGNGTEGLCLDNLDGGGSISVVGQSASNMSSVSSNGWDGIAISTMGKTTLNNLFVYANGMDGLHVGDEGDPTGNNVMLNNVQAHDNTLNGLYVQTNGAVTAKKLSAQENGGNGAYIYTAWGGGAVTVSTDSYFSHNGWNDTLADEERGGLNIFSGNHITLNKVIANGNYYSGVTGYVNTFNPTGNITLSDVISVHNGFHGIDLQGDYAIKLTKVVSMSNGWNGMGFPQDGDGLHIVMTAPTTVVTLKSSSFIGNLGDGIDVQWYLGGLLTYSYDTYMVGNDTNRDGDLNRYLHF